MSVRSAGKTIREARLKAGLTQEKLSEGICTVLSLSRIENETAGVSPATFQALMTKAGAPCEVFPVFANRKDFDCFYTLKKARYYMDSWQLQNAYDELIEVQKMNWADNKFYYQEWLLLYCKIQSKAMCDNYTYILNILLKALHISKCNLEIENFRNNLLSFTEIELLILCAQQYLHLGKTEECLIICTQVISYLENSQISKLEKNHLIAENAIAYSKYLIYVGDYKAALELAEYNRHQMVLDIENPLLYELTFLTSICYYYLGNYEKSQIQFETAFYSSYAIDSCYATTCKNYAANNLHLSIENMLNLPDVPYPVFPIFNIIDVNTLNNGIYEFSSSVIYFGDLIHEIRLEKKISQETLCMGLCSKSKLSKIENNLLQPSIALAETLLQRLGINERIFTFLGNEREQKLHDLKYSLLHSVRTRNRYHNSDLQKFKELLTDDDTLYLQFYLEETAYSKQNHKEKLQLLFQALSLTLPEFDIYHVSDYRLSYMELTILNSISLEYIYTNESYKSSILSYSLLEYMNQCSYDLFMQIYVFSATVSVFCNALYKQKLHNEVMNLKKYISTPYFKYAIQFLGQFLFYYCQSLCECNLLEEAVFYAKCCCSIQNLIEFDANAIILKKNLIEDFNIDLN